MASDCITNRRKKIRHVTDVFAVKVLLMSKHQWLNITSTYPLELVYTCLDFLKLDTCNGGYTNVLVIIDHYTRFAQAFPTKKTTAEIFFQNFILKYGFPTKLLTDQGSNFESQLMAELCKLPGIKKLEQLYTILCVMECPNGSTDR